jgi:hypothetical protein
MQSTIHIYEVYPRGEITTGITPRFPVSISRLWQPHSDEYMLVRNSLVAVHTLQQLSESNGAEALFSYFC